MTNGEYRNTSLATMKRRLWRTTCTVGRGENEIGPGVVVRVVGKYEGLTVATVNLPRRVVARVGPGCVEEVQE